MNDKPGLDRRHLTPEEIESIKKQIIDSVLADMARSVIKKILWVFVIILIAVGAFLTGSGHIKL